MKKEDLIAVARNVAAHVGLDPALLCAIVEQESGWNQWAIRFEPAFLARYVEPIASKQHLSPSESNARATSWGLMQVMGQVAREIGFAGASLAELCEPSVGLQIGCEVFARKLTAANQDTQRALLLWNGGANINYPTEVLVRVRSYEKCSVR